MLPTFGALVRLLSRLLVRSFRDFSSILEEMAFSKKSLDAILPPVLDGGGWTVPGPGVESSPGLLPPYTGPIRDQEGES